MKSVVLIILILAGMLFISTPVQGQEFSFQTYISSNNVNTQVCTFGLREGALHGLDEFDIPSPPPTPGNSIHIQLAMTVPPAGLPNQWLSDFRPILSMNANLTEFWIVELTHDLLSETATIFIEQPTLLPTPFELWLHQPNSTSTIVDVPGAIEVSLDAPTMIFFWELRIENSVPTNSFTWGGIKSLYRKY